MNVPNDEIFEKHFVISRSYFFFYKKLAFEVIVTYTIRWMDR